MPGAFLRFGRRASGGVVRAGAPAKDGLQTQERQREPHQPPPLRHVHGDAPLHHLGGVFLERKRGGLRLDGVDLHGEHGGWPVFGSGGVVTRRERVLEGHRTIGRGDRDFCTSRGDEDHRATGAFSPRFARLQPRSRPSGLRVAEVGECSGYERDEAWAKGEVGPVSIDRRGEQGNAPCVQGAGEQGRRARGRDPAPLMKSPSRRGEPAPWSWSRMITPYLTVQRLLFSAIDLV